MPIERRGYRWEHHTGSYAYLDEIGSHMVGKSGKSYRQAHLHVYVPSEHEGKGIGTDLLKKAVRDLGEDNKSISQKHRFYRVFSKKVKPEKGSKRVYDKAKFQRFDEAGWLQYHYISNYKE